MDAKDQVLVDFYRRLREGMTVAQLLSSISAVYDAKRTAGIMGKYRVGNGVYKKTKRRSYPGCSVPSPAWW